MTEEEAGMRRSLGELSGNLLEGQSGKLDSVFRMFQGDAADAPGSIDVQESVLVEVAGFDDLGRAEFDVEGVGILEVFNFHGLNDRSKNALCTVSPSGKSTTRRYLPPAWVICAQRRIRPSCRMDSFTGLSITF